MNEYWEITHGRAVATQAVWGMQPAFELNNLTLTQHGTLTDSLPTLAGPRQPGKRPDRCARRQAHGVRQNSKPRRPRAGSDRRIAGR